MENHIEGVEIEQRDCSSTDTRWRRGGGCGPGGGQEGEWMISESNVNKTINLISPSPLFSSSLSWKASKERDCWLFLLPCPPFLSLLLFNCMYSLPLSLSFLLSLPLSLLLSLSLALSLSLSCFAISPLLSISLFLLPFLSLAISLHFLLSLFFYQPMYLYFNSVCLSSL